MLFLRGKEGVINGSRKRMVIISRQSRELLLSRKSGESLQELPDKEDWLSEI